MVLSYNYAKRNRNRRQWQTNAPPLQAILMAMVRRWSDTWGIARCSMSRTGLHRKPLDAAIGRLLAPYCLGGRQGDSKQNNDVLCAHFDGHFDGHRDAEVLHHAHCPIEEVHGFHKSHFKHRHRANTCFDSINQTRQRRLFIQFHREKGLELTCWPQITIGVWHIKLMRSTYIIWWNTLLG